MRVLKKKIISSNIKSEEGNINLRVKNLVCPSYGKKRTVCVICEYIGDFFGNLGRVISVAFPLTSLS